MAYNTPTELTDYATARGITLTTSAAILLTKASDYIESRQYKGQKSDPTQANQFPRKYLWVDGVLVDADVIPEPVKIAELQTALAIEDGYDPLAVIDPAVKREKVDVLETEYQNGAAFNTIKLPAIQSYLRPYLASATEYRR
jgi:hypothetical protein